jgi:hypothetical protein
MTTLSPGLARTLAPLVGAGLTVLGAGPAAQLSAGPAAQLSARPGAVDATVCTGVPHCTRVATVDVDGDHHADQVGIVPGGSRRHKTVTIRVRTATHRVLRTTSSVTGWGSSPWFGAAPVDGRAGAELVVGSTAGAHYEQFRVVTYRKGRLTTLGSPPALPGPTSRWGVDGSFSSNIGVFRAVSTKGVVTATIRTAERNASGTGHTGRTTVYRWRSGAWREVSTRVVRYSTDRAAYAVGGWHVKGLKRFA